MKRISGIYTITNTINGKIYYGSSVNIRRRWYIHRATLKRGKHHNPHLQNAWDKYGENAFRFDILKQVPADQLLITEQAFLDIVKQTPTLYYNISFDAECCPRGYEHTTIKRLFNTPKYKRLFSKLTTGENNGMFGKKHSYETIKMMSDKRKTYFKTNPNPMFGKRHSDKTKKIIREKRKYQLPPHIDKTIYTFKNTLTRHTFTGIQKDFIRKYNLRPSSVSSIIHGRFKTHNNWIYAQQCRCHRS